MKYFDVNLPEEVNSLLPLVDLVQNIWFWFTVNQPVERETRENQTNYVLKNVIWNQRDKWTSYNTGIYKKIAVLKKVSLRWNYTKYFDMKKLKP